MTVQILMSTYNGERYIQDQLESLIAQDYPDICLFIRDDGSTDRTMDVLAKFALGHPEVPLHYYAGENKGVVPSFFELLSNSSDAADFYAYCDQDDVWLERKISRAISKIKLFPADVPVMYCSRTQLVDESLNKLGEWPPEPLRGADFPNALVQNIAVGCTTVINKSARDLLFHAKPDFHKIIMHDWWSYLCVSAFGQIVYDPQPHILYRQHGRNAMGGSVNFIQRINKRHANFQRNRYRQRYREQAREFYLLYKDRLSHENRKILEHFISEKPLLSRIGYAMSGEVYRHSKIGNVLLKLLIIADRY